MLPQLIKNIARFLLFLGSNLYTLVFIVLALPLITVVSETGRLWLIDGMLPELLAATPFHFDVVNPASNNPGHWYFERLVFRHGNEDIVNANHLELSFSPISLLSKRLDIDYFRADYLKIDLPQIQRLAQQFSVDEDSTQDPDSLSLSKLNTGDLRQLLPVRVTGIDIKKLVLDPSNHRVPALSVVGNAQFIWADPVFEGSLKLGVLEGGSAVITIRARVSDQLSGKLDISVTEQADGWLAAQLQIPRSVPLVGQMSLNFGKMSGHKGQDKFWKLGINRIVMPVHGHNFELSGDLILDEKNKHVSLNSVVVNVDSRPQKLSGWISAEQVNLKGHLNRFPLSVSQSWQDVLKGGNISGSFRIDGAMASPRAETDIVLESTYQGKALYVAAIVRGNKDSLRINQLNGSLDELSVEGAGKLNLAEQTMNLQVASARTPLHYLSLLGIAPVDNLRLDMQAKNVAVTGPFANPNYKGFTEVTGDYKNHIFHASAFVDGDSNGMSIRDFDGTSESATLAAKGLIDWTDEQLQLELAAQELPVELLTLLDIPLPHELNAGVAAVTGNVIGPFDSPRFDGNINTRLAYTVLNEDAAGASADVIIDAAVVADPHKVRIADSEILIEFLNASDSRSASLKLDDDEQTAELEVRGEYQINRQLLDLQLNIQKLPLMAYQLAGLELPYSIDGNIEGNINITGAPEQPTVAGLVKAVGTLENQPYTIDFLGEVGPQTLFLKQMDVEWGGASLNLTGSYLQGWSDFIFDLNQLDLAQLSVFGLDTFPAKVSASMNLKGSMDAPDIQGEIELNHQITDTVNEDVKQDLGLQADILLRGESLTAFGVMTKNSESKGNLRLSLPWRNYLNFFQSTASAVEFPLLASVNGNLDLDWLEPLLDTDIHQVDGFLDIDLVATGDLATPYLTGLVSLKQGYYGNKVSRSLLEDGELEILFEKDKLSISAGKASDGENGQVFVLGFIDWGDQPEALQFGKIDLAILTKSVRLLRRDELDGEASGRLELTGDFRHIKVDGTLEVSPLRIVLDLLRDASIPELEIVVIEELTEGSGKGDSLVGFYQAENASGAEHGTLFTFPRVNLNILMKASRQAFVRGRGLNAELAGRVRISGNLEDIDYRGKFSIVRGTFDLLGRKFELTEGDMLFANDAISVFVEGKYTDDDYQYLVRLSGGIDDLAISLTTVPELSQDEAISQLLFGKFVQDITPFQAVTLAQAVQQLRGQSGGFDPLSSTRDILRLDDLKVESAETETGTGVSVGVGKYINDRVYVELERSADAAQPWQGSIEVELNPKVVLQGATDEDGGSSVDLKWKHDY